jgi:hypothetical protein
MEAEKLFRQDFTRIPTLFYFPSISYILQGRMQRVSVGIFNALENIDFADSRKILVKFHVFSY